EHELKVLHQLLRTSEQATRIRLAGQKKATSLTPMTPEMQRSPQCVLLMGDVGIGKTRLAEETGREAKRRGWAVAWSRAYAQESIVLDDLQWADGSSCELLSYLVRQLRGHPVMIVGTCRDIELPANHPLRSVLIDLQREQAVELLTIERLTDEQIRALLSHLPEPV